VSSSFEIEDKVSSKPKLVHWGFRIEEEVLDNIKKAARRSDTTVSSQTNKILNNWVTRDIYFQELGFIPVSKDIIRAWLSKIEQKDLVSQAKDFGSLANEFIIYFFGEVNEKTLIKFLDIFFSRFQAYQHSRENKTHYFSINHDICINYSIFLSELLKTMIEHVIKRPIKISSISPKIISLSFSVK
jgi:hypothetical protein